MECTIDAFPAEYQAKLSGHHGDLLDDVNAMLALRDEEELVRFAVGLCLNKTYDTFLYSEE